MANKNFKVKNGITIPEPLALTDGGTGIGGTAWPETCAVQGRSRRGE